MDYYHVYRFHKLRAIWAILRNGSVIWNADLKSGSLDTTCGKNARGVIIAHNLTINGRALSLTDIRDREDTWAPEGDETVAGDEDARIG